MPSIEIAYSYKLVDIPNKTMVSLRIEFPPTQVLQTNFHPLELFS
jgi:hypothetical protein